MSDDERPNILRATPTVRRALAETLPEAVAVAAFEFITGPPLEQPHRVGKHLLSPLDDRYSARRGSYRISTGSTTRLASSPLSTSVTDATSTGREDPAVGRFQSEVI